MHQLALHHKSKKNKDESSNLNPVKHGRVCTPCPHSVEVSLDCFDCLLHLFFLKNEGTYQQLVKMRGTKPDQAKVPSQYRVHCTYGLVFDEGFLRFDFLNSGMRQNCSDNMRITS